MKKIFWALSIILVSAFLTACQLATGRISENGNGETSETSDGTSKTSNVPLVESFIHTQPDTDFSYLYNVTNEKGQTTLKARWVKKPGEKDLWDRIRAGFRLPLRDNARVQAEVRWYANRADYLDRIYERADPVLHYIVEQVERRGMPLEIALLPIVESAYQPFAYSRSRASGLWQFIPETGKYYGLHQSWWYDGRRDIIDSTRGSLDYLTKLHKQFKGDWLLALAAYNSGESRVEREVNYNRRHGRPTDFWSLRLPNETRAYVPKLLAIRKVVENSKAYGLTLRDIQDHAKVVPVKTGSQIDLAVAAELANIGVEEIYKLNPGFNRWATCPDGPHRLLLPVESAGEFKRKLAALPANQRVLWKSYTAKSGETLTSIALQHNITPDLLRRVNTVSGDRPNVGQALKIPVSYVARAMYTLTLEERFKGDGKEDEYLSTRRKVVYRARGGEYVQHVAKRFHVTNVALAKWNDLTPTSRLRHGQRLIIYVDRDPTKIVAKVDYKGRHTIRYLVRRGDTLMNIARRFRISVKEIKRWNSQLVERSYIVPGQRLTLHLKG